MTEQRKKLMQMLTAAVKGLDRASINPARSSRSSASAMLYMAESLIATTTRLGEALYGRLEMGLGRAFTPEVKEAWTAVWTGPLATTMRRRREAAMVA